MNLIVNNNPIIKLSTPIYKVKNGSQGEMRKNFIVCLAESPEFALGRMLKMSDNAVPRFGHGQNPGFAAVLEIPVGREMFGFRFRI